VNNQGLVSSGSDADFTYLNPNNLENSSYDFPSENASLFAENILFLTSKLTMNFGVRYEYITSEANGFYKRYNIHPYTKDTIAIYKLHDSNRVVRNVPLFGFGLNYKLKGMRNVYANYTQNYRAINFTDIRVANPNILVDTLMKDEKGYTLELGYRGLVKDYLTFDLAIFNVFYGNKIGLAPKANSIYKERTNIGDAMNLGIEAFGELDIIGIFKDSAKHNLNIFLNAAYIDARYIRSKEPNFVGKKVEYVSPVVIKSGLKWKWSKMTTQIQISYNSPQFSDATNAIEPSGDAVIGQVPAYTVVDLSSKYQINKQFQVELGVNNLTNQSYYTRRATAYPGPGILPSDGITAYFTLQYKFALKAK
jgi:Fe(3+) dicitrate transport protein